VTSPSVTFVIPVLNEQDRIGSLLRRLAAHYPDCERLVVDGGSRDNTVAEALPQCDSLLIGPAGRALQMNLGARAASGDYLFFLHADSWPTLGNRALQACLRQQPAWGYCRVQLSGRNPAFRVIAWAMNVRSRLTRVATGDQMIFLQRKVLDETGGYAAIPLMEDIEYCKRLRRRCAPRIIWQPVETSSRRWEEGGIVRTVMRMWALRLGYFLGVQPQRLWHYYYGR